MKLRTFLIESGIYPNLRGFNYLIKAVEIVKKKGLISMTKELYPMIAEEFNISASCVSRGIYNVIHKINLKDFKRIGLNKIPTGGEFIYYFSEVCKC